MSTINGMSKWSKTGQSLKELLDDMTLQHEWVKTHVAPTAYTSLGLASWEFHNPEDELAFKLRFGIKR